MKRHSLWYEERRPGLGFEFAEEINRAVYLAAENPESFPIMHRDIRCVRARGIPAYRRVGGVPCASRPKHVETAHIIIHRILTEIRGISFFDLLIMARSRKN